jgi:hypothetical protein
MSLPKIKSFIFVLWSLTILLMSCQLLPSESAHCPIEDLLIKASDLPGDEWEEVGSRSYRDAPSKLGNERIGTGFSTTYDGIAEENIYRFSNDRDAINGYVELADLWHRLETEGSRWSQLDLPSDISINANDYRAECSISTHQSVKTCWYIARYDKTVIEFRSTMIVKEKNFFDIVEILDEKIVSCGLT